MIEMIDVPDEAYLRKHTLVGASHATIHEALLHAAIETVDVPGHAMVEIATVPVDVVTDLALVVRKISIAMSQALGANLLTVTLRGIGAIEAGIGAIAHIDETSTTDLLVSPNPIATCQA